MVVSTKAVASGVAGVGGTTAAGYGISTAIEQQNSGSQQTQSQNSKVGSDQEPLTIAKKLKEDGYTVLDLTTDKDDEKWYLLASAIAMSEKNPLESYFLEKKNEIKKNCKVLLKIEYSKNKESEYKKAFEECTELESLKKMSEKSGFTTLTKDDKEIIKSRWTNTSTKQISHEFRSFGLQFSDDGDYELATVACENYSDRHNRFNTPKLNLKLSNYQKICTATPAEISRQTAN